MKKKTKIILFIVILFIIAIIAITYTITQYEKYTLTILEIDGSDIRAEETVAVPQYYYFSAENAKIKDINGNNIDISNLQVGNVVEVTNKKDNSIDNNVDLAYSIEYLSDVKQIKVIDDKVE